jgi:uncharacterized protein (TIGR02284 family)
MQPGSVIHTLNHLIEVCRNGEHGFHTAAEHVRDGHLKSLLVQFSEQRAQFATELRNIVAMANGDPENSGTLAGTAHRGWMNLKSAITGGSEEAIVNECERGEDAALSSYREALEQDLPADIAAVIEKQHLQVKEVHDTVRTLADKLSHA